MKWKVFFACAAGKYHLASNAPCQDAGQYTVVDDVLIGVVCDGAGSASEGQFGSDFVAKRVAALISDSIKSGQFAKSAPADCRAYLFAIVEQARSELDEIAAARRLTLRDFACTLVGCVASRDAGCFFHIGDGFAIYMKEDGESVLSQPENGEYSDQTYFVTDDSWSEHLRVTPLSEINRGGIIGLMSDGTSPFAVNRPKTGFYRPFIDPVVNFLKDATEENGNQALKHMLEDEKTYQITSDDKTLLLALAS